MEVYAVIYLAGLSSVRQTSPLPVKTKVVFKIVGKVILKLWKGLFIFVAFEIARTSFRLC